MKHQLKLLVVKYRERLKDPGLDAGEKRAFEEAIADIQAILDEWAL